MPVFYATLTSVQELIVIYIYMHDSPVSVDMLGNCLLTVFAM
jgi:hypothetical protein